MNKLVNVGMFLIGGVVGSMVTLRYLDEKYERRLDDDIASVREMYERRLKRLSENVDELAGELEIIRTGASKPSDNASKEAVHGEAEAITKNLGVSEYISKLGYTNYSNISEKEQKKEKEIDDLPYVISPDEFGSLPDYDKISLTLYEDGVLAEDRDIVEDVDNVVGEASLTHFGEYEDDSVFVRNDRLKCDFEILKDFRTYEKVIEENPY